MKRKARKMCVILLLFTLLSLCCFFMTNLHVAARIIKNNSATNNYKDSSRKNNNVELKDYNFHQPTIQELEYSRNAYVCITGQLSRLELRNKIDKLFSPLHNKGYRLFVGLALSTDAPRYVNDKDGEKMRLYSSIAQVRKLLMDVNGIEKVSYIPKVNNLGDVYVNEYYRKSLGYKNTTDRVVLNARQYRTLQYCHQPKLFSKTSFFIRMREDTFIQKMNLDPIIAQAQGGSIVTTECDSWWGINDKIAFGPSSHASVFFSAPFKYYMNMKKVVDNFNPEQLYMNSYVENGLKLQSTSEYVVTKAHVLRKSGQGSALSKIDCSVTPKPYQKWAKKCPQGGVDNSTSYSAVCHPEVRPAPQVLD